MTISDAELTALYGNGLRPDTAARLIDDLRDARAQYAELERAEMIRDEASRAQYAELMTRDQHNRAHGMHVQAENDDLRARLAVVEALCDNELARFEANLKAWGERFNSHAGFVEAVRAAATGDGPQPADIDQEADRG